MQNQPLWTVQLFERTCLALEAGMLKGRKFTEKVALKKTTTEEPALESAPPTNPKRIQLEDRTLKYLCPNFLVASVVMLEERDHQRIVDAIIEGQRPLDKWHTEQNRSLRSTSGSRDWLVSQISGALMESLEDHLRCFSGAGRLRQAGFIVGLDMKDIQVGAEGLPMHILTEDEHADFFGQMCLSFISHRAMRSLFMLSWPTKMIGVLKGRAEADTIVKSFKQAEDDWKELVAFEAKGSCGKIVQNRHVMSLRSNKQFQLCFADLGYQWSADLEEVVLKRANSIIATQANEDCSGEMKKHHEHPHRSKISQAQCVLRSLLGEGCALDPPSVQERGLLGGDLQC